MKPIIPPYKLKYAYTLYEIMKKGLLALSYTNDFPHGDGTHIIKRSIFNAYSIATPSTSDIPEDYVDKDIHSLFSLVMFRYWNEYVFESEELLEDVNNIPDDVMYQIRVFCSRFLNILEFTWKKYTTILSAYESNKNKLMDRLQKIIDGEINNTGYQTNEVTNSGSETRRDNDTPQDSGTFDDDSHTSFITEGTSSTSGLQTRRDGLKMENDVTESWDDTSIIERLEKIESKYQLTMKKWVDEFGVLFIDGGNYHEI